MFSSDDPGKDICHVGSALFMGNSIRLMCSNQVDTLEQTIWCERIANYAYEVSGIKPFGIGQLISK